MSADTPAISEFMGLLPEEDFGYVSGRPVYCIAGVPSVEAGPKVSVTAANVAKSGLPSTSTSQSITATYLGAVTNDSPYDMQVIGRIAHTVAGSTSGISPTPAASYSSFTMRTSMLVKKRTTVASPGSVTSADSTLASVLGRSLVTKGIVASLSDASFNPMANGAKMLDLGILEPGYAFDVWIEGTGISSTATGGTATWRKIIISGFAYGVAFGV